MNVGDGRLPALVLLVIAIGGLGWAVHGLTRPWPSLESPHAGAAPIADAPTDEAAALPPAAPDLRALSGRALFGSAPPEALAAAAAAAARAADAPPPPPLEPAVPLELLGTLPGPASASGHAIVGTPEGQFAYRVGEALPGGATLQAVERLGITVVRGTVEEHIPLPVASAEPGTPALSPALPPAQTYTPPAGGAAAGRDGRPGAAAAAAAREHLRKLRESQRTAARQARPAGAAAAPVPVPTPQAAVGVPASPTTPAASPAATPDGSFEATEGEN